MSKEIERCQVNLEKLKNDKEKLMDLLLDEDENSAVAQLTQVLIDHLDMEISRAEGIIKYFKNMND